MIFQLTWNSLIAIPRAQPLKQLLTYPLSIREQSLLHSYALNPPNNLPATSIPVIHDLVCVRLIQSGQFAAAIKLDRQLTPVGSRITENGKKSNQDRRQMMDELMAIMPSIERQILESELSQLTQGKDSSMSGSNSGMADSWISVGNVSVNDLSMSWEHVRPNTKSALPLATPLANGSTNYVSGRVGAPRFAGSARSRSTADVSLGGHLVSTNPNPFPPIATNRPPAPPFKVSISTPLEPSTLSRSAIRFGQNHPAEAVSLFDSVGSANQTRNAFYEPPPAIGTKRHIAQDERHHAVDSPTAYTGHEPENEEDADVSMHSDDKHSDAGPSAGVSQINNEPASLFSFSVFGTSSTNGTKPGPSTTDSKSKMPPGAFMPESEDELEPQITTNGIFSIPVSPPLAQAHSSPRASRSRPGKGRGKNDMTQSIPGSLLYGETDAEDEDVVAPLPRPKRPQRTTRTATRNKVVEEQESLQRPIRRSSRLSTASSRESLSPERISPQKPKPKKNARTAGISTKSSGRRKQ
jgi:hypothetical protein